MGAIPVCVLILGLGQAPVPGELRRTEPRIVEEVWEVVHRGEVRIGSVHTTVERLEGNNRLRTTSEMELNFLRGGNRLNARQEQSEETAEGKVQRVFLRQFQGANPLVVLTGTVADGQLHVVWDGGRSERRLRWGDDVAGLHRKMHQFAERKPRPGERFSFRSYEPTYNTVVTIQALVKEREEVAVLGKKQNLLRVELTPDPIELRDKPPVQLPGSVVWLDEHFVPVRRQMEMNGLGTLLLTRTTREIAMAGGAGLARLPDINLQNLIPLNRAIANPYASRSAVYRITLRNDRNPGSALVQDEHQDIRNLNGATFELHVHPPLPGNGKGKGSPGAEYLAASYYISSDDPQVRALARQAVGTETDPWRKAQRMERWVYQNMKVDNAAPLVPAGTIARDRRGDCRHYALLTTALCRAEGLPARTALGLIYVARRGQPPALGFHMWTEVWIAGQWLGLDGTLGRGGVSATHVKISQHSWHETRSLTPLLPVERVLGKLEVAVVEVRGE